MAPHRYGMLEVAVDQPRYVVETVPPCQPLDTNVASTSEPFTNICALPLTSMDTA